jgi:hypothetical protein
MRELTSKQKKLLAKWQDEGIVNNQEVRKWEDLTIEQAEELEKINDTEILYQNVNSYLHDRCWEKLNS